MAEVLGLTGRAQHGKDSVGQILVNNYGFERFAFADALKSLALTLDPFINGSARLSYIVHDGGWEYAKTLPEVRRFLQVLGTEGIRGHFGNDTWVAALEDRIGTGRLLDGTARGIVLTDVRFPNEAEWVKEWGGTMWRIKRITTPEGKLFDNGLGTDHPSEAFVDKILVDRELQAFDLNSLEHEVKVAMAR